MGKAKLAACLTILLLFAAWGGASPDAVRAETLQIGSIWGLSGPGSQVQVIMRDAALMAVEWLNKKGGIEVQGKKYTLELIIEDNKNSANGSLTAATKLVHRDGVKFITGMIVPFQIEAVQTITESNKIILCTGKCAYLRPQNKYTFSSTQAYVVPMPSLYDFLLKKYPNVKTVYFSAHDEPGGLATLRVSKRVAQGHGLKELGVIKTQFGTKEYYPTWTKILPAKPDAVDIGIGFPDSLAANCRQARELGYEGPVLTCGTGDSSLFIKLIGAKWADDFIFAGFDMNSPDNPEMIKKIKAMWEAKYKEPFNLDALDGWSAVWALAQAIEKAQSLDPDKIVTTWQNMESIQTPWGQGKMGGRKTFGLNNMVIPPIPVSRLKEGKVDSTEWYKPEMP